MSRTETSRSIRLRLALATAALTAVVVGITLGVLYVSIRAVLESQIDDELSRELAELVGFHDDRGRDGLGREIDRRSEGPGGRRTYYYYSERRLDRIAGNLPRWPEGLDADGHAETRPLPQPGGAISVTRQVRMASVSLDGGRRLMVGRDVTDQQRFQRVLGLAALGSFGVALVAALGAGLAVSRGLLRRVEGMNRTVLGILGGETSHRVPVGSRGDEFDELAVHFNHLLDENHRLIERMRQFTDDVAHDLRTPLARIRAHAEAALAASNGSGSASQAQALHALIEETNRVLESFNAVLRIAQIESRAMREHMEAVDLARLASDAVDLYQPAAEEAGLALEVEVREAATVQGDRHLLAQALTNLIDNALKYGGSGDRVTVSVAASGDEVRLAVADGGPGIPAADRERVLERFVRLDASRHQPGTGLGLAFVAVVARLHGARLILEDAEPGLRATICFGPRKPPEAGRGEA